MALPPLPVLNTVADATSFSTTISPYLPQLSLAHLQPLLTGSLPAKEWYLSTNPVISGFLLCLLVTLGCFLAQEVNGNWSEVDRLWSVLPVVYVGHFTLFAHALGGGDTQRLDTLATLVALWGVRLTFNFFRKGGYKVGSEDYRHDILRKKYIPKPLHTLWSFLFLALFQNVLLYLIALPAYVFLLLGRLPSNVALPSFTLTDGLLSQGLAAIILIETIADQQQWSFQSAKEAYKKTGVAPVRSKYTAEDLDRGFVVSGLWSWSRHPNFACEQAIWVGIYQWTCVTADVMVNWSALGCVLLLALFQGSVTFSESISAAKYSEYKEYQKCVAKFIPGVKSYADKQKERLEEAEKATQVKAAAKVGKKGRGGRKEL